MLGGWGADGNFRDHPPQQTRKLSFREDKGTVITFAATLGPSQDQKCTDTLLHDLYAV